jgi:heme/copper-type cytochrome/quinol oxidase subunit 3
MITNVSSAGGPFYDGMGLDLLHIVLGIFFCSIIYAFIQEVNQEKANAVEAGNPRIAYKSKETV